MSGLFITFEGGEGSGKTTQSQMLAARLRRRKPPHRVVPLHEPGGTPLGEYIRRLGEGRRAPRLMPLAELLLFAASRAELVQRVIRPELKRGSQSSSPTAMRTQRPCTRAMPEDYRFKKRPKAANSIATGGVWPDLTFLLDINTRHGLTPRQVFRRRSTMDGRVGAHRARAEDSGKRRFEELSAAFHREGARRLPAVGGGRARAMGRARRQSTHRNRSRAGVGAGAGTAGLVSDSA